MKYLLLISLLFWQGQAAIAQTLQERTVKVQHGQEIRMVFEYPKLVTVRTWDRQEMSIKASVSINNGNQDDAFELKVEEGVVLLISSQIQKYNQLPKRIMIHSNDADYYFDTSDPDAPEIQAFKNSEDGSSIQYMQHGVLTDISIEIMIPQNIDLSIRSKFGMVEVKDFIKSLEINAKHGGIDVTYAEGVSPVMQVESKFGEVYSNLSRTFSGGNNHPTQWNRMISEGVDSAGSHVLISEFGNIFLRSSE